MYVIEAMDETTRRRRQGTARAARRTSNLLVWKRACCPIASNYGERRQDKGSDVSCRSGGAPDGPRTDACRAIAPRSHRSLVEAVSSRLLVHLIDLSRLMKLADLPNGTGLDRPITAAGSRTPLAAPLHAWLTQARQGAGRSMRSWESVHPRLAGAPRSPTVTWTTRDGDWLAKVNAWLMDRQIDEAKD